MTGRAPRLIAVKQSEFLPCAQYYPGGSNGEQVVHWTLEPPRRLRSRDEANEGAQRDAATMWERLPDGQMECLAAALPAGIAAAFSRNRPERVVKAFPSRSS
jgi:uncharacterized protein (DUF2267 family)